MLKLTTRLFWVAEGLALAGAVGAAAWLSRTQEWQPLTLVGLLLVLVLVGHRLNVGIGSGQLTTAHIPLVLGMTMLGPAPAVSFGLAAAILTSASRRLPASRWLNNLFTFSVFPVLGALMARALLGDIHDPGNQQMAKSVTFGLVVFAVFVVTIALNFALVALDVHAEEGRPLARQVREAFIPLLPGHLATGLLAAILALAYTNAGLPVLFGAILVLLIFHNLTTALLRSEDRADQLEARSIHLANLQFGVLTMLMDALALRDRTTSRHATAVARYAKALAIELGCDESEQEVIHTAALLHDIGKFTWSDRILHPDQLTDDDWAVIRRHPQDGAALVGKLDGYGAVADAILYHHERVDGGGYPAGLIGNEIPLASRIVAICSTYDTMTMRRAYGPPMTPGEAMEELRKCAGHQLDAELVESFIAMLEREGLEKVADYDDADYEAELAFEQRVRKMAQPSRG
ncbi:MAG: HD domain-containing phosphohydrolase [Solirubrobacteraceae bacterium]|jgi:putative nucleotidyltransferase with HDIG domain